MPIDVASGSVSLVRQDFRVLGRKPLAWERTYNSALLATSPSGLGRGWSNDYFMTLTRVAEGVRVMNADGSTQTFSDPESHLDRGGVLRDYRSFRDLKRQDGEYVLTQWNVESETILRYVFAALTHGPTAVLVRIENASGYALDLFRNGDGRLSSVVQRHERRTLVLTYDRAGRIERVDLRAASDRVHPVVQYAYDRNGQLITAVDGRGAAEHYEYDRNGRLRRDVAKDGGVLHYRYDQRGRCVKTSGLDHYDEKTLRFMDAIGWTEVIDSHGEVTRFQWLPTGQVTQVIDPVGASFLTRYDDFGRIVEEEDPLGAVKRYRYDERGDRVEAVDALGHRYEMTFNERHQPLNMLNPAGGRWTRVYDDKFRLTTIEDPCGLQWRFGYDERANLARITIDGATLTWLFDAEGHLRGAIDPLGYETRYECDDFGRVVSVVAPDGARTTRTYDVGGEMTSEQRPDGTYTTWEYDAADNLTRVADDLGHSVRYRYGPCGRLLEIVDENDRLGQLEWGTEPGELLRLRNAHGETYEFERDAAGQIVRETGFDGRVLHYTYDAAGNLRTRTNAQHTTVTYISDAVGRTVAVQMPDGTATYTFDLLGNIAIATNSAAQLRFDRDPVGRILKAEQDEYTLEYSYTPAGKPRRTTTSLGHVLGYEFDLRGMLSRLGVDNQYDVEVRRNRVGAEIERSLPGGLLQTHTVDPGGRLLEQNVVQARRLGSIPMPVVARQYSWEGNRVVGVRDGDFGWSAAFSYDSREQITHTLLGDGTREEYRYDELGNLIETRTDASTIPFEYEPGNRLIRRGRIGYVFDADGRVVAKGVRQPDGTFDDAWTYEWDSIDQLTAVTNPAGLRWQYGYDPFGRRIAKVAPDGTVTKYVWDRDVVVHEHLPGDRVNTWLFEPHTFAPVGSVQRGRWLSVVTDHIGAPRELLDEFGFRRWAATYALWGGVSQKASDDVQCPLRFQGQWHDEESGLYYTRHRYYDPEIGRFISPDPIGLRGGLNGYRFAPNPVNWIDPYGLDWNYVLTNPDNATPENPHGVYYSGVAADSAPPSAVEYRHGNNVGRNDEARFDPSRGDKLVPVTPTGTSHETARGMEQKIAKDFGTVIGRQGSEANPDGSVRGNNQNPVNQDDSNKKKRDSRAKKADDFLAKKGKTTGDLVDDGVAAKDKKEKEAKGKCNKK